MGLTDEYWRYCSDFASTPTTSALDRIGARLSEEVLARILFLIQGGHYSGKKEKHEVGQLALTCRYWATKCQPPIFEEIWLSSGKDVDQLLSLMASPLSRVAGYIKWLGLFQDEPPDAPWLHLVPLRLVPKLSRLDTARPVDLFLSTTAAIRSIHNTLPRSYPSFSSHFSILYLENAHFNSFADLLHVVDEISLPKEASMQSSDMACNF
ncbi:hypothetical protein PHLCEN_2v11006 [Hermanssonia centrifuga]|uniref:F-box domain-containing protein n=1 Tax=Hermanssonia centrifuga TaxID=98765 RepID=A0A2R6NL80_9APHY|nr:hypothetical protein PHLCEN_2v11006 [Hermanssonia centrifuga]